MVRLNMGYYRTLPDYVNEYLKPDTKSTNSSKRLLYTEFPELPYREVIISPYRFFYKIKDDVVWIVSVLKSCSF